MDEGRKRVLLIAAAILASRKLANWDGKPSPTLESAISDAIALAERILGRIDSRWPMARLHPSHFYEFFMPGGVNSGSPAH